MTKARDLANLISGGFTEADIPNLSASKITSGTFADARIAASNVSQHATSFDDNKIVNDLSTLALRQASNENKAGYNTNSMSVDVFQDATKITNLTNVSRSSNEFIGSAFTEVQEFENDSNTVGLWHFNNNFEDSGSNGIDLQDHNNYSSLTTADKKFGTHSVLMSGNANQSLYSGALDALDDAVTSPSTGTFTFELWLKYTARSGTDRIYMLSNRDDDTAPFTAGGTPYISAGFNDNGMNLYGRYGSNHNWTLSGASEIPTSTEYDTTNWHHLAIERGTDGSTLRVYWDGVYKGAQAGWGHNLHDNFKRLVFGVRTGSTSEAYSGYIDECRYSNIERYNGNNFTPNQFTIANATGSFEGTTVTAPSSVSSMGAIITYENKFGTNALNTDIVLKLSADNGSNYSTATLTAMPDFSSGIKMAKVNDLSVTAGTQLKYKLEFANQASGSKEARIRGVSLQY